MGARLCLAVAWVAWAVWTIKPTLNRNDEGPGFLSGPFFFFRSHGRFIVRVQALHVAQNGSWVHQS